MLAMGADGTLYVGEDYKPVVRAITPDGQITSVVGDLSFRALPTQTRCNELSPDIPSSGPARSGSCGRCDVARRGDSVKRPRSQDVRIDTARKRSDS